MRIELCKAAGAWDRAEIRFYFCKQSHHCKKTVKENNSK